MVNMYLTATIKGHWKFVTKKKKQRKKNQKKKPAQNKKTTHKSRANSYDLWSCQKVTDALIDPLDKIYIRFSSKLYRQNVGIPMGTNCAPLVADLFLFCYERLTNEKRYDLIDAFNSTSRYHDDLLNIDNIYFEHMFTEYIPLNFS